jgi:cellulose 1,4-beta-cellobiosidase
MKLLIAVILTLGVVHAQKKGTQTANYNPSFTIQTCTSSGCTDEQAGLTMDSNWRWTHDVNGYTNCYTGNTWDTQYCPNSASCTQNCALDGIAQSEWPGTYGVTVNGNSATLKFVTKHQFGTNIGSRTFILDSSKKNYRMFSLLNKEITFDVDVSQLPCGLNGALYLVEMDKDGGLSEFATNECGAEFGTGYCDAQCPHDMKWINGEANCDDWQPSDNDVNSGAGKYGICCPEMDLWEANSQATAYTSHPCTMTGYHRCESEIECGDDTHRHDGICDKDGCDFASYRLGDTTYYGNASSFKIDTTKKMTVVTQFLAPSGTLTEIRRKYVQNGQVIENSKVNVPGVTAYDSITENMCNDVKDAFGDVNAHQLKGGLAQMGKSLQNGMVFVMSLWDDHSVDMLWLDSVFPVGSDPNVPGNKRGPCPPDSGIPSDVETAYPNAQVVFSNVKYGDIDSTY